MNDYKIYVDYLSLEQVLARFRIIARQIAALTFVPGDAF